MAKKKKIIEEPIIKEIKVEIPDTYILKVGENLEDVSKKFGISLEELNKINNYPTNVIGTNQIKLK